jgi:DNA-binding transcriptional LysR family regulator
MNDRWQELTVFVRAAESGSFSRASRELGLSQPSVSRIIGALERRLGVTLLLRSTRRVTVTDAGSAFLDRAKQILADLDSAEDAARGVDSLRGLIRIAMPVTFGHRLVIPSLPPFLARHPELRLELVMSDSRDDLIAEGADVAIRLGPLDDSSFGARRLMELERFVVAAPGYLAKRGTPRTPGELSGHDLIFGPGVAARSAWAFKREGAVVSVEATGRIRSNTAEGMMACVRAGLGVALASSGMAREELAAGTVTRILQDYRLDPIAVHAVFPAGPKPSAKVRALVDHLGLSLSNLQAA